jgi:hypothetical protein
MELLIDENELRKLLVEAYESGWRGSLELKDEHAEQSLSKYKESQAHQDKLTQIPNAQDHFQIVDPQVMDGHTFTISSDDFGDGSVHLSGVWPN